MRPSAILGARTMNEQYFCDFYPHFLETSETVPAPSRLNARWRAIIGWNDYRAQYGINAAIHTINRSGMW
jgi:hypothetical protein